MKKLLCHKCGSTFWPKEDDIFQHGFEITMGKYRKLRGASCPYCKAVSKIYEPYHVSVNYLRNKGQATEDIDIYIKINAIKEFYRRGSHFWPECMGMEMDLIRIFKEAIKDDLKRKYRLL